MRPALALAVLLLAATPPVQAEPPQGWRQTGIASWYGRYHHGRKMANGKPFDMNGRSAAHRTLPLGTLVRVTARATGRSERVRIDDRGPYIAGRIIDISAGTARRLGIAEVGISPVIVEVISWPKEKRR